MFLANLRGIETGTTIILVNIPKKFLANLRGIETENLPRWCKRKNGFLANLRGIETKANCLESSTRNRF